MLLAILNSLKYPMLNTLRGQARPKYSLNNTSNSNIIFVCEQEGLGTRLHTHAHTHTCTHIYTHPPHTHTHNDYYNLYTTRSKACADLCLLDFVTFLMVDDGKSLS